MVQVESRTRATQSLKGTILHIGEVTSISVPCLRCMKVQAFTLKDFVSPDNSFLCWANVIYSLLAASGDSSDCISNLLGLRNNLKSLPGVLAELAVDKGLAYYDRSNQLETVLENTVNLTKGSLNFINTKFKDVPVIGSSE